DRAAAQGAGSSTTAIPSSTPAPLSREESSLKAKLPDFKDYGDAEAMLRHLKILDRNNDPTLEAKAKHGALKKLNTEKDLRAGYALGCCYMRGISGVVSKDMKEACDIFLPNYQSLVALHSEDPSLTLIQSRSLEKMAEYVVEQRAKKAKGKSAHNKVVEF